MPGTLFITDNRPRRTIAYDKHGARPLSCLPRYKSYAVTSVCQMDYSWHCCTGNHHCLCLLNFCGEMLGGRSIALTSSPFHRLVVSQMILWTQVHPHLARCLIFSLSIHLATPYINGMCFYSSTVPRFSESDSVWDPPLFSFSAH